jgi:hypothetical protein
MESDSRTGWDWVKTGHTSKLKVFFAEMRQESRPASRFVDEQDADVAFPTEP